MTFRLLLFLGVEGRFYPSGCGGHKNSENIATFSEFLGREEKSTLRAYADEIVYAFFSFVCVLVSLRLAVSGLQSSNFANSISETAPNPPVKSRQIHQYKIYMLVVKICESSVSKLKSALARGRSRL